MSDADKRHAITVEGVDGSFACGEQQSLLSALAPLHRRRIECGCRGGGCGVCRVEILEGEVETGPMSADHVSAEERAQGLALSCRVYPRSNVKLRVLGLKRAPGSRWPSLEK